jgi:HEAT repeat protein
MRRIVGRVKKRSKEQTAARSLARVTNTRAGQKKGICTEDERWTQDIATLRRAAEELVLRRSKQQRVAPPKAVDSRFQQIAESLDDPSAEARQKAVRDLYELDPDQAATLVNDALRAGSPEERRRIGTALADSGLLYEAINDLMGENHETCYGAFSLLFLVAKAGVVQPIISVIEKQPSLELSLAVIRLLASSGEPEVVSAFQRLAVNNSLPSEVRSAAADALNQLTGPVTETAPSAA